MRSASFLLAVFVSVALGCSIVAIARLDRARTGRRWGDHLRSRFVLGVPWGTIVVAGFVLAVYLFVQGGWAHWYHPVTMPFRAWSYFYPTGMLAAGFAHAGPGHLLGNLIGTALAAPIAEYAWGHYPSERGSTSFSARRRNPWLRAFVLFPAAAIVVGLLTSVFALGPVIGFSGVVFAFAGFAIVRYPIATVLAVGVGRRALTTTYNALREPILIETVEASPPSPPSWAETAIQGHALGFFVGFLLALAVFRRRRYRADPLRLWLAVLLFGFVQSMWAVYWYRGSNTFVLYRGLGVVVVTALALVVTLAVVGSERPFLPASIRRRLTERTVSRPTRRILELGLPPIRARRGGPTRARIRDMVAGAGRGGAADPDADGRAGTRPPSTLRSSVARATPRGAALLVVVVVLALLAGPAIPFNSFVLGETAGPGETSVEVRDYSVTYAEGVENELISVVEVEAFGEDTAVETGGVIVTSPARNIWWDAVSEAELAHYGQRTVHVGGPGWREPVTAVRRGWSATGGDTAYQVWLLAAGEGPRHVFTSEPARSDVTLAGYNVTVVPRDGAFFLEVETGGLVAETRIPQEDGRFTVGPITFERDGRAIYGEVDETRAQVASRETYR